MEVNKRTVSDAPDAYMMPDATKAQQSNKNEDLHQGIEMAHPSDDGLEKSSLNVKVLKVTSGNVTKRLGIRRDTRATT